MLETPDFGALHGEELTEFLLQTSRLQYVPTAAGEGKGASVDLEHLVSGCGSEETQDLPDPFGCFFGSDQD